MREINFKQGKEVIAVKAFSVPVTLLVVLCLISFILGCGDAEVTEELTEENMEAPDLNNSELDGKDLSLPAPSREEGSVADALYRRVSQRSFSDEALDLNDAATLLWAAGGLNIDGETGPTRTSPSAGGTYPLDFYLVAGNVEDLAPGIYRYDYINHDLVPVIEGDRREPLAEAALGQGFIAEAPASIVFVAHFERTTSRYGERGERYVYMDTGYAAQSVHLQTAELGLGTVAIGAFDDAEVAALLETDGAPLKIMPVGRP